MAAEAARALDFSDEYYYGSAVPAGERFRDHAEKPDAEPSAQELLRQRQTARETAAGQSAQSAQGVSMFAILGSIVVGILMIFAVLAQVSYNEVANETVRLKAQISSLEEEARKLEIVFESVVDMKDVEVYARDVLGMSKPDSGQVAVIHSAQRDTAEIVGSHARDNTLRGFGSFLSSLAEYLKR